MIRVNGVKQAKAALKKSKADLDRRLAKKIELAAEYVHISLISLTAVWMGTSVRNWIWTMDAPSSGSFDAKGSGDPGRTNSQALGTEARRAINEAASTATFTKLKFNPKDPYHSYFVTNNDPKIAEMEAGLLPTAKLARTQDMVKITHRGVLSYIKTMRTK